MAEISVIMPVYNTKEEYLRQAIESVLKQTFQDFEFLILNDSPENPEIREIIAGYGDDRIHYSENNGHLGIPQSYNKLLEMAQSKYVAIMNHDDIMMPKRLEKQYKYMEAHKDVGILGTGYKKFGEINRFKKIHNPLKHEDICAYLLFKSAIHHPTIMLRHSIVSEYKIRYNENFISLNDRQLYCEFSKYSKLANLPDVLYKYRFHPDMTSKKQKGVIVSERAVFHKLWFAHNNIVLKPEAVNVFDHYTTYGRRKIKEASIIANICETLDYISEENHKKHFLDEEAFDRICGKYMSKRCFNAIYHRQINIRPYIEKSKLPINHKGLLKLSNALLGWRN